MVNIIEEMLRQVISLGFLNLLIFFLWLAVIYAILRKSRILGESPVINSIISFVVAFFIFSFPTLMGIDLISPMINFFAHGSTILIVLIFSLITASLFYPDFPRMLAEQFKKRTTLYQMLVLAIILFITSGFISVFTGPTPEAPEPGAAPMVSTDIVLMVSGVLIFMVVIIIASAVARGGA